MRKSVGLTLVLIGVFMLSAKESFTQQQAYTPANGSTERKAIVDALRVSVKKELKKPVIFNVSSLKVKDGWAVIYAFPLNPNGGEFDWRNTPYESCIKEGDCDNNVAAVLRKQKGIWIVFDYAIGSTDVPSWGMGRKKYKLPAGLQ